MWQNETEVTELMKAGSRLCIAPSDEVQEAMSINLIDAEEYPSMVEIEQRWCEPDRRPAEPPVSRSSATSFTPRPRYANMLTFC